jgi:hypothetical protein
MRTDIDKGHLPVESEENAVGTTKYELPDHGPEVPKGQESRDFIANRVGFPSGKSYDRTKNIVEKGTPELVTALDRGEISIRQGTILVKQSEKVQREILHSYVGMVRAGGWRSDLPSTSRRLILAGRFLVRLSVIEALVVGKPVKLLGRWKQIVRLLPGLRIAESAHS